MRKSYRTFIQYIALMLCCVMLTGCTQLFFFPMPEHVSTPSEFGYEYEDIFMQAEDDTRLHAWLIEPKPPFKGTVYFLHGNAQNISTHYRATLWLLESGYQVFGLDYRGYGLSEGKPDVPEVFSDIEAGAQWITQHHAENESERNTPLFLLGQSLGGTLAIKFAQLDEQFSQRFDGLMTEAAFSRFDSIAKHVASGHWLTWSAQYPAKWLIRQDYDPLDAVTVLDGIPKLMIHSKDDEVIPFRFGEALFQAAAEPKQQVVTYGMHIRGAADPAVRQAMLDFMQRYGRREMRGVQ